MNHWYGLPQGICSLLVVTIGVVYLLQLFFDTKRWYPHESGNKKNAPPPVAPCGIMASIEGLSSRRAPYFLLDLMRRCNCDIFKLRLPIRHGGLFIVADPKAGREILLDKDSDKSKQLFGSLNNFAGSPHMFTRLNDDIMFHHARKGIAPAFSSSEVKRMTRICTQQLEHWTERTLTSLMANDEAFDPSEEMSRVLFHSIMDVGFEYKSTNTEYRHVHKCIELALTEFAQKEPNNPLRKVFGFFLPERREAFRAAREVQSFMLKVLNAYCEKKDKSPNNTIIKLIVENPAFKTDKERVAELVGLMFAGHDTTAYQISSTLVLLAKNPPVAEKLRLELSGLDSSEWSKSTYLRCVIKESERFMPVGATGGFRVTGRDFYFKDGSVVVPEGANVCVPFFLVHRNPAVFFDPNSFRPERWLEPTEETNEALIPFSVGNRNCVGQRLGKTQLYSCIPLLLSKYKFEVVEEGTPFYFLTFKIDGAKLRAVKVA